MVILGPFTVRLNIVGDMRVSEILQGSTELITFYCVTTFGFLTGHRPAERDADRFVIPLNNFCKRRRPDDTSTLSLLPFAGMRVSKVLYEVLYCIERLFLTGHCPV